jgi:hypothetical protein
MIGVSMHCHKIQDRTFKSVRRKLTTDNSQSRNRPMKTALVQQRYKNPAKALTVAEEQQ